MTRETKLGLVVSSSFLILLGGLIARKVVQEEPAMAAAPPDEKVVQVAETPARKANAPVITTSYHPEKKKPRKNLDSARLGKKHNSGALEDNDPHTAPVSDPLKLHKPDQLNPIRTVSAKPKDTGNSFSATSPIGLDERTKRRLDGRKKQFARANQDPPPTKDTAPLPPSPPEPEKTNEGTVEIPPPPGPNPTEPKKEDTQTPIPGPPPPAIPGSTPGTEGNPPSGSIDAGLPPIPPESLDQSGATKDSKKSKPKNELPIPPAFLGMSPPPEDPNGPAKDLKRGTLSDNGSKWNGKIGKSGPPTWAVDKGEGNNLNGKNVGLPGPVAPPIPPTVPAKNNHGTAVPIPPAIPEPALGSKKPAQNVDAGGPQDPGLPPFPPGSVGADTQAPPVPTIPKPGRPVEQTPPKAGVETSKTEDSLKNQIRKKNARISGERNLGGLPRTGQTKKLGGVPPVEPPNLGKLPPENGGNPKSPKVSFPPPVSDMGGSLPGEKSKPSTAVLPEKGPLPKYGQKTGTPAKAGSPKRLAPRNDPPNFRMPEESQAPKIQEMRIAPPPTTTKLPSQKSENPPIAPVDKPRRRVRQSGGIPARVGEDPKPLPHGVRIPTNSGQGKLPPSAERKPQDQQIRNTGHVSEPPRTEEKQSRTYGGVKIGKSVPVQLVPQGGLTWEQISQAKYNSPKYAAALREYNAKSNPKARQWTRVPANTPVELPNASELTPKSVPVVTIRDPEPTRGSAPANTDPPGTYRVRKKGMFLWKIAQEALGDGRRWSEIYRLNPQVQPELPIEVNTVLQMPLSSYKR